MPVLVTVGRVRTLAEVLSIIHFPSLTVTASNARSNHRPTPRLPQSRIYLDDHLSVSILKTWQRERGEITSSYHRNRSASGPPSPAHQTSQSQQTFLLAVLTNDSRPRCRVATVLLTEPDNRNNGQRSITGWLLDGGAALGLWRYPTTKHQSPNKVTRSKAARPHALLDGRMASATAFRGTVAVVVDSVISRGGGMGCCFNARIGVFEHPNIESFSKTC